MIMRIAFYYRKGNTTFGCMLPEEKERFHVFFAAEQKREAAKSLSRKLDHGDKKKKFLGGGGGESRLFQVYPHQLIQGRRNWDTFVSAHFDLIDLNPGVIALYVVGVPFQGYTPR